MADQTAKCQITLKKDNPYGSSFLDVVETYNLVKRKFQDRNPEMEIRVLKADTTPVTNILKGRSIILCEYIAGFVELVEVVKKEVATGKETKVE